MSTPNRKRISKRLRFEVFKRDGFRCTYCGATPTDGPLHIDHVVPVASGGDNDPSNLVTACAGCNLGKGAVGLNGKMPSRPVDDAEREQAEQIRQYLEIQREIHAARRQVVEVIVDHWGESLECDVDAAEGRFRKLLEEFSPGKLMEAIDITTDKLGPVPTYRGRYKVSDAEDRIRYFYGVIRRWREQGVTR